ncbi:histidinol dehydrogenase [Cryobacterium mesophilum]|uniref:Histidinol dehydrogenase n=1 Tax=Terrimesophilobacter mesophilus TaxID=433647 RepID=A0A4R8V724_9MICO|nr:histidinol dehydrogenase [Terrimesophilobacter mesophilus]MBB5632033.1 histidinol dehydrogenase [Terrimesophilobacter mesophilus]TFB78921.1 histidinol dehydrogenase [Terrimesophilobacter mesophilus]
MITTIDLRGTTHSGGELSQLMPRARVDVSASAEAASGLIDDVRQRGSAALLDQAERLDGVRPDSIRVPDAVIRRAVEHLAPAVREALDEAIRRVRAVSSAQLPVPISTGLSDGGMVQQRWRPIRRVGLYVPGGKAVYPSSVVMNVVPAQVAGVASLALASPPQKDFGGSVHPTILAAAGLLGIDEVYAMGGAGAIGAFAWGVPDLGLEPVDLVTGPGNVWVAAAKRIVRGQVGIDAEAGPTEILVIADESADPVLVAADLVSQAEHDELAAAVLVTDSAAFAERTRAELGLLAESAHHGTRVRTALDGQQSAIVIVDDIAAAAGFSNAYGPEHLELQVRDPDALLAMIDNAGAIFVGEHSPVSLGDYLAGSNHVLPTGGQARFSSGLGVATFLRPQQVIRYEREGLREVAGHIHALANAEDLPAHAAAVSARFRAEPNGDTA